MRQTDIDKLQSGLGAFGEVGTTVGNDGAIDSVNVMARRKLDGKDLHFLHKLDEEVGAEVNMYRSGSGIRITFS